VLVLLACALVATVCTVANVAKVSLLPPSIGPRDADVATAVTRVAVDLPQPLLRDSTADDGAYENLQKRAVLIANLMSSDAVLANVARRAGVRLDDIAANTRVMVDVQPVMLEPDSERRAAQIADATKPYELEFRPHPRKPTITLYALAPSVPEAERLLNAVVPGVRDYLGALAHRQGASPVNQIRLQELGSPRGGVATGIVPIEIAVLTFIFTFVMALALVVSTSRWHRRWRERPAPGHDEPAPDSFPGDHGSGGSNGNGGRPAWSATLARAGAVRAMTGVLTPAVALPYGRVQAPVAVRGAAPVQASPEARPAIRPGDWPRTTRVLPWLVAAFMAVVWLVPFNEIQMTISLPVDLKFDRLVLPVLVGVWVLVLAGGGPDAPKIRVGRVHLAVFAVIGMACLSLVLQAHSLTRTLEFDAAVKKLTLLGSYVTLFVIVASVIRRSEVRPFMTLTMILASICAFGTVVEYNLNFNMFFWASDRLLPGLFSIGEVTPDGVDEIGRRLIRGPGQVSLETVAMMSMALPIALARLIHPAPGQRRWANALFIALCMAAMMATFRKTALVAPVSVCLTIAYFRRRELLKLAPLGVVLILLIQVLSPGALTGVTSQLDRSRLGVTTVSDRSADYDAIRPEVWTHLLTGRGYGSYTHTAYRILDMELLRQIVEVGVLGLIIYLALPVVVVLVARGPIRARGPDAPVALAAAASGVCFIVVSTLFDVMSFPHVPYIFLFMAGILAVLTAPDTPEGARWRR
jgi:hypothetical protein